MDKVGIVYLVGAGPGDPGLITVKGLECIKKAEVLVYDRLASKRLLSYAPKNCEMIYVGKLPDRHTLRQEEINQLLVDKGLAGKIVTRLKGGDPYVYGRGGEEGELLRANGVPFEVVPGITSAIAVPAYAGIPVTHRDCTSSFAIITGHEDPNKTASSIAWDKIATGIGTLVFLMGVGNLSMIVKNLVDNGRAATTPVALIRWGTRPEQQVLTGTLADIVAKVAEAGFTSPAIIIVGEVVKLRETLSWFEEKPFFGKRVVVTRSREQASDLSRRIEEMGGEAWEFPAIEIVEPEDFAPMDEAIAKLGSYQWLIFTSVNGVDSFFSRLRQLGRDIRALNGVKLCAIGPKTKERLEEMCLSVEYVPSEYVAEAIIAGLRGKLQPGERVLLPRADIARAILPESLANEMGAVVDNVVAYRTVRGDGDAELLKELLAEKMIHYITFTSSSTVKNFVEMLAAENIVESLQGVKLISIGPITSQAARDLGLTIDLEASEYTIDGLLEAFARC
ncbi:MAG: uroporphyrinogen-III C-methyltransferase [Dethiobacter sp.]|jgi:uroporphyrinogen III methyltransferase/synthase|nr:uroporphyrinogen-III C-methyltransferase [Dethiobacter sp.]MBS3901499.1 uroporphyrinogen-III C-methyltransferase [Dethiobacter sp.]